MCQLGTSYRTAWLIHQKLVHAIARIDAQEPLDGLVQMNDAYLGGERPGVGGSGSPNKAPIVVAFSTHAITAWAHIHLSSGYAVHSDGLTYFAGVIDAGCVQTYVIVSARKPRELPQFTWLKTFMGNLMTMIHGRPQGHQVRQVRRQYLGAFAYRFNSRFDLAELVRNLLDHAALTAPTYERQIRGIDEVHD